MHCKKGEMNCVCIPILVTLLFSWSSHLSHGFKASLVFEKEPENVIVVVGKKVSFSCRASASGKEITYFWKLNGSFLDKDNAYGFKISKGLLQINNVTAAEHRGAYECLAFTKDLGSIKSKKANLRIAYFSGNATFDRREAFDFPLPYIVQAPKYKAFPTPTFVWQYYKITSGKHRYTSITDLTEVYVTSKGNLLMPSFLPTYLPFLRLYIYHPAVNDSLSIALTEDIWMRFHTGDKRCQNPNMMSFPTITNKTVGEGSSVFFECFVVAKSCNDNVTISWTKAGRNLNETSRRLVLKNVTKKGHEGTYECHGKNVERGKSMIVTYSLTVVEKPKLLKEVNTTVKLPEKGILQPAVFQKGTTLSWYKDGEIITYDSVIYRTFPNGDLKIKHPSPAFNGIFQMFYENLAGVAVVSQAVTVDNKVGCGWKIVEPSGTVTYTHNIASPQNICTWLFQVPTTKLVQFRITKFDFEHGAMVSFYDGATASGAKRRARHFSNVKTYAITSVRGPFITMIFDTNAGNSGGFSLSYGTKLQVSTGRPPAATTNSPVTTATKIKPTTINPTKVKPTKTNPTKIKPTKMKQNKTKTGKRKGCDGGSNAGAIVGAIIGTLVFVALVLLVIYRKKVLQMCIRNSSTETNTKETPATPMFEVDSTNQAL